MKTFTIGLILSTLISSLIVFTPQESLTNSSAPLANKCYVPGGGGCGDQNCHNAPTNAGNGSITATFSGTNNEYVPGATYTISVTVTDASKQRFGFQATATDANNNMAGTFTLTNPTLTSTQSAGGKTFVGHKSAGGNSTWSFDWTAPSSDVGPIKLYLAGNAANGNNNTSGDNIYTNVLPLNAAQGVGIASLSTNEYLKIISQDFAHLIIETGVYNTPQTINLFSVGGQTIYQNTIAAGETIVRIPCNDLSSGIYILQCGNNSIKFVKP
jgi:hypothetical protein